MNLSISSDLAKEVLTFLEYCDEEFIDMLPDKLINKLTNLAVDSEKEFEIIEYRPLYKQNMTEDCKNYISYLYLKYANDKSLEDIMIEVI